MFDSSGHQHRLDQLHRESGTTRSTTQHVMAAALLVCVSVHRAPEILQFQKYDAKVCVSTPISIPCSSAAAAGAFAAPVSWGLPAIIGSAHLLASVC